ncbi:hypothetical protein H6G36_05195 [Anabaena minutissima FACHB-250]|nr:hypothetical protein [Anabaena minutissima FACHB-250]
MAVKRGKLMPLCNVVIRRCPLESMPCVSLLGFGDRRIIENLGKNRYKIKYG